MPDAVWYSLWSFSAIRAYLLRDKRLILCNLQHVSSEVNFVDPDGYLMVLSGIDVLPLRSVRDELGKFGSHAARGVIKLTPFGVQAISSACAFSMGLGVGQVCVCRAPALSCCAATDTLPCC